MKDITTDVFGSIMRAPQALMRKRMSWPSSFAGLCWKAIILSTLLFAQGCLQSRVPGNYSLYHVRTYNQFAEPGESYIKNNANVILHVSSQKLDREFVRLDALVSEGQPIAEYEANSLLVRHIDGASYRLGSSSDCSYLVIFNDDRVVCDKHLYTSVFKQFESPLSESD